MKMYPYILNYQQKVQNMIRLLLQEKSDQVLYCLHMNFCPSNYAFNGSVSTLYQVFYFFSKSYLFHKTLFMVTLYKTIWHNLCNTLVYATSYAKVCYSIPQLIKFMEALTSLYFPRYGVLRINQQDCHGQTTEICRLITVFAIYWWRKAPFYDSNYQAWQAFNYSFCLINTINSSNNGHHIYPKSSFNRAAQRLFQLWICIFFYPISICFINNRNSCQTVT